MLSRFVGKDFLEVGLELEAEAAEQGFTEVEFHPPGYPGSKTINLTRLVVYLTDKGAIRFMTKG